jgi:hypothetical protein
MIMDKNFVFVVAEGGWRKAAVKSLTSRIGH